MNLNEVAENSAEIRELYHELELKYHNSIWTVEEDALAFLTDAALIGRLTMANQERWPAENQEILPQKIGECVWWLAVLAKRMNIDFENCVEDFISSKLHSLKN